MTSTQLHYVDFTNRLNALFDRWQVRHGTSLSHRHLIEALGHSGVRISKAYVSQLRSGHRRNPSIEVASSLARLFGVDLDYFTLPTQFDDPASDDTRLVNRLRHAPLRRLLQSFAELNTENQQLLLDLTDQLRAAERLPDVDPGLPLRDRASQVPNVNHADRLAR